MSFPGGRPIASLCSYRQIEREDIKSSNNDWIRKTPNRYFRDRMMDE